MAAKNNSDLFYTCSLIEYIGREKHLKRKDVVKALGRETISRIYSYADVLHCEPIAKVACDYINQFNIPEGNFDNLLLCRYNVPDYWTMGEVYERLIEDGFSDNDIVDGIMEVYQSWIDDNLSDYNTDFYYQPRDYIAACYKAGEVL